VTSILDVWRATDPEARLVSGSEDLLGRPIRGVARTRAMPPHLPDLGAGQLLVADAAVVPSAGLDGLLYAIGEPAADLACIWIVGHALPQYDPAGSDIPVLAGAGSVGGRTDSVAGYLDAEPSRLTTIASEVRLAAAEAALGDPRPGAPAGVVATRLRRGVAVAVDGALASLSPRPAGRALATRFAAAHTRLLAERSGAGGPARRTRDGLWVLSRSATAGATAWLFDDVPFARVDEAVLDALALTLRALLRRPAAPQARQARPERLPPSTGDPLRDTLLAVARANGRVAPAARSLGVHRNTVLYRLRRASAELGIDPRRPEDALRLLESSRRE
jgi:hypothetical protein